MPEYKWIYQRRTVPQQRKQWIIFSRTEKRKKVPICEMLESSGFFSTPMLPNFSWKIIALKMQWRTEDNSKQRHFTIPSSSKLELLCQCEMTSWYYIVTKSFYLLWERLKFNQVNINIFKVKKKSNTTTCEICPKVTIQAPKRR